MSFLKLGIAIKNKLEADADLTAIVGNRIYPIEAPEGAEKPYIIYQHPDVSNSSTKDGISQEQAYVVIGAVSDNYDEAVEIIELFDIALSSRIDDRATGVTAEVPDMTSSGATADGNSVYLTVNYTFID